MNAHRTLHPTLRTAALSGLAGALAFGLAGCKGNQAQSQTPNNQDPATANLAQPYTGASTTGQAQVLGQSQSYAGQSSGESYETQTPAPIIRQAPAGSATSGTSNVQYYPVPQAQNGQSNYDASYDGQTTYDPNTYSDAEEAGEQALVETDQAPPPLPEYDQPPAPEDDYIWTPGYWNYASTGYYWVPGVWCAPPFYGALWTPPYWAYNNNRYLFHRGYWGPHVGYYGGINYGFGYIGFGYYGGYWRGHDFFYNRAVTNINADRIHNFYQRNVVYDNRTYGPHPDVRISYNGGRGGLNVQPRPQELAAMREAHYAPLPAQREVRLAAASNREQFFRANAGRPAQAFAARPVGTVNNIPATPREQAFNHPGAPNQPGFGGRPGTFTPPAGGTNRPGEFNRPGAPNQPGFAGRPGAPNQPGNFNRPGEFNRPGAPGQPAQNTNTNGNFNTNRNTNGPGQFQHPGAPNEPGRNFNTNGNTNNNGNFNTNTNGNFNRPGQPATGQPAPNLPRAGEFHRPGGPAQNTPGADPRSNFQPQTQGRGNFQPQPQPQATPQPQAQPRQEFHPQPGAPQRGFQPQAQPAAQPRQEFRPQPQQQPQARPSFQEQRPAPQPRQDFRPQPQQQQPQARPNFQPQRPSFGEQRPAPQPQAAPAAPSRPAPAPRAEAPRGGGSGGEHPHMH